MTHSAPYLALLTTIVDQQPRWGYDSPLALPQLSAADVALVCETYPHEMDEFVRESFSVVTVLDSIREADVMYVGVKYLRAVSEAARFVIFDDVQELCEKTDEPPEPDGEAFRGGEYAASVASEQDWIRRHLK